MNWEAIGAIGEVAGAMVVVATLIYLSVQLRHNARSIPSNNSNNVMQGFNLINTTFFADPD